MTSKLTEQGKKLFEAELTDVNISWKSNGVVDISNHTPKHFYGKSRLHEYHHPYLTDVLEKHLVEANSHHWDVINFFTGNISAQQLEEREEEIIRDAVDVALSKSIRKDALDLMDLAHREDLQSVTKDCISVIFKSECIEVRRSDGRDDVIFGSDEAKKIRKFFTLSDCLLSKKASEETDIPTVDDFRSPPTIYKPQTTTWTTNTS